MSRIFELRLNDRPSAEAICALREAVGWDRNDEDYPDALTRCDTTAAAYDNESDSLIGWCAVITDGVRHGFFVDVIVHPDRRRRGVASSLVRAAIEDMKAHGISLVHADFSKEHAPFYERCGFQIGAGGFLEL